MGDIRYLISLHVVMAEGPEDALAMKFATVCSGIEAPSVAWPDWDARWFSEIEPFPSAVLNHHYPDVPNLGDMNKLLESDLEPVDVFCGGTPCQSFSVAGSRGGMDDPRGNLAAVFCALVGRLRPRWIVWENVPGVLSSSGGRDFGSIVGALDQLGYGLSWTVLDAQYFGLAQRRKRVFLVGYFGDWRRAAAVLFDAASLRGDPAPSREQGQETTPTIRAGAPNGGAGHGARSGDSKDELIVPVAPTLSARQHAGGGLGSDFDIDGGLVAATVTAREGKGPDSDVTGTLVTHSLRGEGFDASEDGTGRGVPMTLAIRGRGDGHDLETRQDGLANAVLTPNGGRGGIGVGAVAFHENQRAEVSTSDTAGSLKNGGGEPGQGYPAVCADMQVRRLTPTECARLQGFPDDYLSQVTYRGKRPADGPMYKALGNSIAVPVLRWIGERINRVDAL